MNKSFLPVCGEGDLLRHTNSHLEVPAIVDNWLRNILQLSTIFLFSQMIVPLDMVNALSCVQLFHLLC